MEVVNLTQALVTKWDRFIDESDNGTIFHKLKFLSYHNDFSGMKINHLVWLSGSEIFAVLPLFVSLNTKIKYGVSPYGSSFGGIIIKNGINLEKAILIIELLSNYCKSNKIQTLKITFPPSIYSNSRQSYIQYALSKKGASIVKRDLFHIVPLKSNWNELYSSFSSSCRNKIKNAKIAFTIHENSDINEFYSILVEDKKRQNSEPTHSLKELQLLKEYFPKNIIVDISISHQNGAKAAICYFDCSKDIIMTFYMCQEDNALGYNGINALLEIGMKRSLNEGKKYLDFGGSTFGYEISNLGVSKFKESFSSTTDLRDTFNLAIDI